MRLKRSISVPALIVFLLAGASQALAADYKDIRLVLVPERNIFTQERKYRKMCDYLCDKIPGEVTFEVLKSYKDVMAEIEAGKAQGGFLGSFVALHGIVKHDFIPLVRPEWLSGKSTYGGVIFTNARSDISKDIRTWEGREIALASRHTSAGYFYPLAHVKKSGIEGGETIFGEVVFAGSHDAAIWMVSKGAADMGAAKNTVFEETLKRKPELKSQLRVLYEGGAYPDSTLVVRPDLPANIRGALKEVLLTMHDSPDGVKVLERFGARRFINTEPEHFKPVRKVVRDAGFDINRIRVVDHQASQFKRE
jgi:phosphonate transport system substrate-binding protein